MLRADQMNVKDVAVEWSESGDRLMQRVVCAEKRAIAQDETALREAIADYDQAKARLATAVAGAPELFVKPRTQLAAGVSFGLRSRPPRVTARPDDLIARLRDAGHSDIVQSAGASAGGARARASATARASAGARASASRSDARVVGIPTGRCAAVGVRIAPEKLPFDVHGGTGDVSGLPRLKKVLRRPLDQHGLLPREKAQVFRARIALNLNPLLARVRIMRATRQTAVQRGG